MGRSANAVQSPQALSADDEIDLFDLILVLWSGKWWIIGFFLATVGLAVAFALLQPTTYTTTMTLASAQEGGSGLSGELASVARFAGISPGDQQATTTDIALETLRSPSFIAAFVRRHDLVVPLLATEGWNRETGDWIIDESQYDPEQGQWVRDVDPGQPKVPTTWEIHEAFTDRLTIKRDSEKGFVTLSFGSPSPLRPADWLQRLVDDINAHMRSRELERINNNLVYLEDQLDETSVGEMEQVLYGLLEKQQKNRMLLSADPEFVFRTVNPPLAPEKPSGRSKKLYVVLGGILGLMIGVFAVLVLRFISAFRERIRAA